MLKHLRIAVTALCLTACVLLVVMWVRSYQSLDVFIGRLSKTTVIHGTSSNGRLGLGIFSSPAGFNWTLKSIPQSQLDTASLMLRQLQKEYRVALKLLEDQRSLALRRLSNDNATLTSEIDQLNAQIDQINVDFQVVSGRLMQGIVPRPWGNPTLFETQFVSEAALGFPSVSTFWRIGAKRGANGSTVVFPHWCAVGLFGALAIAIGIGKRWRFSLRTLLIGTTLVAVALGVIIAAT